MKAYMQDISEIPLISRDEEVELAARIKSGDDLARQKLIKANLRLVVKIAHDFKGFGLPLLDLISEGNIGLMRAAEKFDPTKGAKFSSYSAWWIKQAMRRALSQKSRTIRVPVASACKINRIRTARIQLADKLGRMPTDTEIAEHLDLTQRTVQGLKLADFKTFSLHDPIQKGEDGCFEDLIPDAGSNTPDTIIEDSESLQRLRGLIKNLEDRERIILTLRYGLDGNRPRTLEEVSRTIGRTRERVRQVQMHALRRLRGMIEDELVDSQGEPVPEGLRLAALRLLARQRPGLGRLVRLLSREGGSARGGRLAPGTLGYQRPELLRANLPIEHLELSTRSLNSLHSVGILTIAQLATKTPDELLSIRYFGDKCLAEVRSAVEHYYLQSATAP